MRETPQLKYAFMFPLWVNEYRDINSVIPDNLIVFNLISGRYVQDDEFVTTRVRWYTCIECQYAGYEWETSKFKSLESGNIPNHIEEEIREHVDNHLKFGTWGIMYYKRNNAKANYT